ncbi:MAG: hypothetical protein KDB11_10850 [Planctomycetales bacterium]|nr:hypothetical protein [Planctomycetales bacterium]
MQNEPENPDASQQYAAAKAARSTGHNVPLALEGYRKLIASNPDIDEAAYSRMQIYSIANALIPRHGAARRLHRSSACLLQTTQRHQLAMNFKATNQYRNSLEDSE